MESHPEPSSPTSPAQASVDDEISTFLSQTGALRWLVQADKPDEEVPKRPRADRNSFDPTNPYAVDQWAETWGIDDSEYLALDKAVLTRARNGGDDYLALRQRQNLQWARDTIQTGNQHLRQKDYEKAIRAYNQAIDICPDAADAYVARGCAFANHGKFAEGVADLKRALRLDPDHTNAKRYLDTILKDTGIKDLLETGNGVDQAQGEKSSAIKKPDMDRDFVFDEAELAGHTEGEHPAKQSERHSGKKRRSEKKKHKSSKHAKHRDRDRDRHRDSDRRKSTEKRRRRHSRGRSSDSDSEERKSDRSGSRDRARSRDRDRSRHRHRRRRRSHEGEVHDEKGGRRRSRSRTRSRDRRRSRSRSPSRQRRSSTVSSEDFVPQRPPSTDARD